MRLQTLREKPATTKKVVLCTPLCRILLQRIHQVNTGELGYDVLNETRKIGCVICKICRIHMTNT